MRVLLLRNLSDNGQVPGRSQVGSSASVRMVNCGMLRTILYVPKLLPKSVELHQMRPKATEIGRPH